MPHQSFTLTGDPGNLYVFENGYCANVVSHKGHCCSICALPITDFIRMNMGAFRKACEEMEKRNWEHCSDNELILILAEIANREPVGVAAEVKKQVDEFMKKATGK